jgi:hypothetical protein
MVRTWEFGHIDAKLCHKDSGRIAADPRDRVQPLDLFLIRGEQAFNLGFHLRHTGLYRSEMLQDRIQQKAMVGRKLTLEGLD